MPFSTFLNGRPPTRLRGLHWLSLTDSGNVLTAVSTSDAGGGATQTWNAGTAIPCRVDALGGREGVVASRLSDESTHLVTTPPGTNVTTSNRFAVTGRGTFDVLAIRDSTDEWARIFEVNLIS